MKSEPIIKEGTPVVGFGQVEAFAPAVAGPSPWTLALATSVIGTATGWVIEEIAENVKRKRRRRS